MSSPVRRAETLAELALGTVVILSTMSFDAVLRPFVELGSISIRMSGA